MSERVLTQVEVDRLVDGVRAGRIPSGRGSLAPVAAARRLDLQDPNSVVRRRLPVLELVFGRFSPAVQITLTKNLRFPVRADVERIEVKPFAEFRRRFEGVPTIFQTLRLDPLRGYGILALDSALLYALIDALMGGLGVGELPVDREISDIEIELLGRVHQELLRDMEMAWRPWLPLSVEPVRIDRRSQITTSLSDDAICHVIEVSVAGDVLPACPIHIALPHATLEPLHDAMPGRGGAELAPHWRTNLERCLRDVVSEATGVLGETQLPASRVQSLQEGDLIELPVRVDQDVTVAVQGRPLFRGRLGKSHLNYGIRITERPDTEKHTVDRRAGFVLVRKGLLSPEQLAIAQLDERLNRKPVLDSVVSRGWIERREVEAALSGA